MNQSNNDESMTAYSFKIDDYRTIGNKIVQAEFGFPEHIILLANGDSRRFHFELGVTLP